MIYQVKSFILSAFVRTGHNSSFGPSAPPPAPRIVSMAAFNNVASGCIHGNCTVEVIDTNSNKTSITAVKCLKKGDKLINGDEVECVVKMKCPGNKASMSCFEGTYVFMCDADRNTLFLLILAIYCAFLWMYRWAHDHTLAPRQIIRRNLAVSC